MLNIILLTYSLTVNVAGPGLHHLTGPHIHDFGVWSITAQLRRLERIAPATGNSKMNVLN